MNDEFKNACSLGRRTHLDGDTCLDLLHGFLDPLERDRFLAHIAACGPCEELWRSLCAEQERLRTAIARGFAYPLEQRAVWPTAMSGARADTTPQRGPLGWMRNLWHRSTSRFTSRRPPPLIALGLSVAATGFVLMVAARHPSAPFVTDGTIQARWLPAMVGDVRVRASASLGSDTLLVQGLEAYDRHDASGAIELLSRAQTTDLMEMIRRIYLSSALLHVNRVPETIALLRAVPLERLPEPWSTEVMWTLYVALRADGQHERADSLLRVGVASSKELDAQNRAHRGPPPSNRHP